MAFFYKRYEEKLKHQKDGNELLCITIGQEHKFDYEILLKLASKCNFD